MCRGSTSSPFVTRMPADRMELVRPAVEGTRRAIAAALRHGVERVVLTSSVAAIAYGHGGAHSGPYTAADWTDLDGPGINAYTESKTRAEREAWALMAAAGRTGDLVTINPGVIFGPLLDDDPGTSVELLKRLLDGALPAAARIALIVVDVRDVAAAHVAAMTTPAAGGQRIPMGNGSFSLLQMARILAEALPERAAKMPRYEVPDWMVRLVGLVDRDIRGIEGELGVVKRLDGGAGAALLGRPLIAAEEAIVASARSLVARGLA
jgi:nucleoside-diphosphate-sugar epimerase